MNDKVILVDHNGCEVGHEEKERVHKTGLLHRSFGVFIVNSKGDMLIHKRAIKKKHCAGLWSHACSSHPKPGEDTKQAAQRRLEEEMGLTCELQEAFPLIYRMNPEEDNPCDHGYAHLFIGVSDHTPTPNDHEIEEFKWMSLDHLLKDVNENPSCYTTWFRFVIESVALYIKKPHNKTFSRQELTEAPAGKTFKIGKNL